MIKLFVGVPGAGKSLAMQDTVRILNRETKLGCVVIDRTAEWGILGQDGNPNPRWRGDAPPLTVMSLDDAESDIREALQRASDKGETVVFQTDNAPEVGAWVRRVGYLVYVDDEIDLTARTKDWLDNPLRAFVHTGRHLANDDGVMCEVHIMGACRRVQNIHTDLTEMSEEVFIFRSQGKNTIKRILDEGWIEDSDIEYIKTQPNLSYLKWTNDGTITRGELLAIGKEKHEKRRGRNEETSD